MAWTKFTAGSIKKTKYSPSKKRLTVVFFDGRFSRANGVDSAQYLKLTQLPNDERYMYYKNEIDPLAAYEKKWPLLYLPRILKVAFIIIVAFLAIKISFSFIDRALHAAKK